MSDGPPLLDVQALDLECDALRERRRTLPERTALRESLDRAAALDAERVALEEKLEALAAAERETAGEVEAIAAKAKEVEDALYSGSVKAAKELEAVQSELSMHRDRQAGVEQQQMELLEEIDAVEERIADRRRERARVDDETADVRAALARAEQAIDGEIAERSARIDARREGLPAVVLTEYDRLRGKERLGGRAAAALVDGICGACRVRLPVVDYNRIRAESADVLACCPRCLRVLVR